MTDAALVSVIVPTLDGAATLPALLAGIARAATGRAVEIVAVDSGSRDGTTALLREAGATILDLGGEPFGHASARNRGASHARGAVLVFLTQDVEPVHEAWLDPLLAALGDGDVVGTFGRQIPRGASPEEAFLASTNYPETPRLLTAADLVRPFGPGRTLFSTAFGAMTRAAWERIPFPDVVMSEDQAWAMTALRAGWRLRYVPEAAVFHGHRFSLGRAFRRNFDSGSSLEQLGLAGAKWRVGLSHLSREVRAIARGHGPLAALHAVMYEAVRMTAFQCGRREPLLPLGLSRRLGEAPRARRRARGPARVARETS